MILDDILTIFNDLKMNAHLFYMKRMQSFRLLASIDHNVIEKTLFSTTQTTCHSERHFSLVCVFFITFLFSPPLSSPSPFLSLSSLPLLLPFLLFSTPPCYHRLRCCCYPQHLPDNNAFLMTTSSNASFPPTTSPTLSSPLHHHPRSKYIHTLYEK